MKTLKSFISDLKQEVRNIPIQDVAVLTLLGHEISGQVQNMIGSKQTFWKDLASTTIEQKERKGWGKAGDPSSPLWATGEYDRSIEYQLINKDKVQIFTNLEYAKYLEQGTAKMPPRPVFFPATKIVLKKFLSKNRIPNFYLRSLR